MEKFHGVLGRANVTAITKALETSGCKILEEPAPDQAPFEYAVRLPDGESIDLVCYAFTANKYRQAGRPSDEHRLQVKYGSAFDRYHELFFDPARKRITLMFGVHQEEGIFVAVDPMMHNPTWFSRSIEFKDEHVALAKKDGWFGWEGERKSSRRKRLMPQDNLATESLVGFTAENFARYVMLERVASGMDTGHRLLLIDKMARSSAAKKHPLELALGLSAEEILDVIGSSFRLLVAVRGSVAERHLLERLQSIAGLEDLRQLDEDGAADFEVRYRRRQFRIECKNVLRRMQTDKIARVDFQKTRASKGEPCSRYYRRDQFEVLAACLHPVSEAWDYMFAPTELLPPHKRCAGRIADKLSVAGPSWHRELTDVLDQLCER
jgi:hypothetical protein